MIPAYFSIFPVKDKKPLVNWKEYSERLPRLEEYTNWKNKFKDCQWGIATGPVSKILVLDDDGGLNVKTHPVPKTWTTKTPSNHKHYYFRWTSELNNKVTTKAGILPEVDTRGDGGYVVFYGFEQPISVTPLANPPKWLIDLLPDKIINLQIAKNSKDWLQKALEEMKVGNIDDTLVRILGKMRHEGWTEEEAFLCLQPLALSRGATENHVKEKILNVWNRYESAKIEESPANSIEDFLKDIETVEWLCEPIVAKKTIGFTAGLPETMKTWILIDLAIEAARRDTGGSWLGRFPVKTPVKVLFIDQERFKGETQRRFKAVMKHKKLSPKDLKHSLFIRCGTSTRLNLQGSFDAFRKELSEIRPDLVIIDSFAAFHTAEENNRQSIQEVLERVKQLRTEFGCAFIFIHHENKFAFRGKEEEREPSIAEMSGSVAIPAVAEFVLTVRRQDSESSFVYHTKSTLASTISPFLVKVVDIDEQKSAIKVEAY